MGWRASPASTGRSATQVDELTCSGWQGPGESTPRRAAFNRSGGLKALEFNHFDVEHKATAVKQIAEREGISLKACVFVGDEFNDLHAIREVGLGIAFNCRDEQVRREADVVIDKKDVREILKYIA